MAQLKFDKMLPHSSKMNKQAQLENGMYEQFVTLLEEKLDLIGLQDLDELPINAVSQHAIKNC